MKNNFDSKLSDLQFRMVKFFKKKLSRVNTIHLISQEDLKENSDELYDLPRTYILDKYGYYNEYAIIRITLENDNLVFAGKGVGECEGRYDFNVDEINIEILCDIINFINE